ncbi:hypothetical protein SKAU_G00154340 [Synaphobranchus kaupii]|uniref:Uncharacterized protein n=1 Tax=Synaphobranchus kaupii TaxID=118154 RepID=A0A9Q1FH94_SYNKA|nr:hypothetical protein SKAU_G00154340 [Synaphobranchus kaupii]
MGCAFGRSTALESRRNAACSGPPWQKHRGKTDYRCRLEEARVFVLDAFLLFSAPRRLLASRGSGRYAFRRGDAGARTGRNVFLLPGGNGFPS